MHFLEAEPNKYKWVDKILPGVTGLFENNKILVFEAETEKIYLVPKELYETYKKMKKEPYSIGFLFAEISGEDVKFSFGTAEKYAKLNRKKIIVNKFGEEKFLYKRNLMKKHVVDYTKDIKEGDMVVIVNQKGDSLGFGKSLFSSGETKEGALVKNVLDRGFFVKH